MLGDQINAMALLAAADGRSDAPVICCPICLDSGWEERVCAGFDCARHRRHGRHTYVVPCDCRPMNRQYQERVARSRRPAA